MAWITRAVGDARIVFTDGALGDLVERGVDGSGPLHTTRQVHGAAVIDASEITRESVADAIITSTPRTAIAIRTADCVPVVLVADDGAAVAVVHSGWPGTLEDVVPAAVDALRAAGPERISAVIGPCIRGVSYEFGADGIADFRRRFGDAVDATTSWSTPGLDLVAAVRSQLDAAGITDVDDVGVDTYVSPDHRSYRRDGTAERNYTVAWLAP